MGRGGAAHRKRAKKRAEEEFNRYRVHAIKLGDLFSFDLTLLIPMFSSHFDSGLQQVVVLKGDDLPINMGIGVFGS
ncbi:hypothetical protein ACLB2K_066461 [Fragaria x ananassa]